MNVTYLEGIKKTLLAPLERYKLIKQNQNSFTSISNQDRTKNILQYL